MSKVSSPRLSNISQEDILAQSANPLKKSAIEFLRSESLVHSARAKKTGLDFVPFVNERDHLGNLLSSRRKSSDQHLMSRTLSTKMKKAPKEIIAFLPDVNQIRDFNFETFKCSATSTHGISKIAIKNLLKPLELKGTQSQCFLTPGRKPPLNDQVPGVGYYQILDRAIYPASKKVVFKKETKLKSFSNNMRSEIEIDPIKSYEKIRQKNVHVPDFTRNTARENHFYSKVLHYPETDTKKKVQLCNYEELVIKHPLFAKETSHEMLPKWRTNYNEDVNHLPIDTAGINEKFRQVK